LHAAGISHIGEITVLNAAGFTGGCTAKSTATGAAGSPATGLSRSTTRLTTGLSSTGLTAAGLSTATTLLWGSNWRSYELIKTL
jgi:hypothetical protein